MLNQREPQCVIGSSLKPGDFGLVTCVPGINSAHPLLLLSRSASTPKVAALGIYG